MRFAAAGQHIVESEGLVAFEVLAAFGRVWQE
jgi:hypothetical protein